MDIEYEPTCRRMMERF